MAILHNGLPGSFTGAIGNIGGYRYKGSYPFQIDFSKVMISCGAFCNAPTASAIAGRDQVLFTWMQPN